MARKQSIQQCARSWPLGDPWVTLTRRHVQSWIHRVSRFQLPKRTRGYMRGFRLKCLKCDVAVFLTFTRLQIMIMWLQDRRQSLWSGINRSREKKKKLNIYTWYVYISPILNEAVHIRQQWKLGRRCMTRKILFWDSVIPTGTKKTPRRNRWSAESTRKEPPPKKKKLTRHEDRPRGKDRHGHTHGSVPAWDGKWISHDSIQQHNSDAPKGTCRSHGNKCRSH